MGGRPSIKGVVELNLESGEKYLLYLGLSDSYSGVLSFLRENYRISEEAYAICDGDDALQSHLKKDGYKIQQCTNHFVKTSMYYLWKEHYPKKDRTRIKKEYRQLPMKYRQLTKIAMLLNSLLELMRKQHYSQNWR